MFRFNPSRMTLVGIGVAIQSRKGTRVREDLLIRIRIHPRKRVLNHAGYTATRASIIQIRYVSSLMKYIITSASMIYLICLRSGQNICGIDDLSDLPQVGTKHLEMVRSKILQNRPRWWGNSISNIVRGNIFCSTGRTC